jgi:anti-sigma B factor antagonist
MTPDRPSPSPTLTIHLQAQDATVVLSLCGELDISSAPAFAEALAAASANRPRELLIDIAAVEFIDSTGLRAILAAKVLCEERSCDFALTESAPSVERLFAVTGVLEHLPRRSLGDGQLGEAVQVWPPPLRASGNGHLGSPAHPTRR